MRKSYDFSRARKNPYAKRLKKAVTIRIQSDIIDYLVKQQFFCKS